MSGCTVHIDVTRRRVHTDGRPVKLGSRAFDLLAVLATCRGRVATKQELIGRVWPDRVVEENNLHVQVMKLRRALGDDAVLNVSGRGYTLALDAEVRGAPSPAQAASLDDVLALLRRNGVAAIPARVAGANVLVLALATG